MLSRSLFLLGAAVSALAQLQVNTVASLIECQPALLSWSGGSPPYFISAIPGGDPSGAALENFPQQTGNQFTWNVNLPAGTSVTIKIVDSTGDTNYNQKVTIQEGSDSSCVGSSNSTSNASGSAAPAGSTGASGASSAGSAPSGTGAGAGSNAAAQSSGAASGSGGSGSTRPSATPIGASASVSGSAAAQTSGGALPLAITNKATGLVAVLGALASFIL